MSKNVIGLTPGTTYYYQVRAYNGGGASLSSKVQSAETRSAQFAINVFPWSLSFSNVKVDSVSSPQSITLIASDIYSSLTLTAPPGFEFLQPSLLVFVPTLTITSDNGSISSTVQIVFVPSDSVEYSGDVSYSAGGVPIMVGPPSLNGVGVASSPAAFKFGDVDGNGYVQAIDASLILKYVVGLIKLTPAQLAAADVNHDGNVNAYDASWILYEVVYGIWPPFSQNRPDPHLIGKRQAESK